jgi:hypothetical protein
VYSDQPWIRRVVETYQWKESSTKEGQMTKHTYTSVWSESFIQSNGFKQKGYNNTRAEHASTSFSVELACGIYKVNTEDLCRHLGTEAYKPAG